MSILKYKQIILDRYNKYLDNKREKVPHYKQLLFDIAKEHKVSEFYTIENINTKKQIDTFSKHINLHEDYMRKLFPDYKFYASIKEIDESGLTYEWFLSHPNKTILEKKGVFFFRDHEDKIVLGLFVPMFYVTDKYDYIVIVSGSIYNFMIGKSKKLSISDKEDIKFNEILQLMESEKIDDLHIAMIDEIRYSVTGRINQKVVSLMDKPMFVTAYKDLYRELLKMIGKDEEEIPEIKGMISEKLIDVSGYTVERTFRVSSGRTDVAGNTGRTISIRRLKNKDELLKIGFDGLGFDKRAKAMLERAAQLDGGLNVLTGKTNSGKTTNLGMLLLHMRMQEHKRIFTFENPVEIWFKMESFIQNDMTATEDAIEKFKNTIQKASKTGLRQDPDVLVMGECRDADEDRMFIDIGTKGFLAYTTMHTGSVKDTIVRLAKSANDIEELKTNLKFIMSTRLISKKCILCDAKGCKKCKGTGIGGMLPMFEMAFFTKQLGYDDDILDIQSLIDKGILDFYSKKDVANSYMEQNFIFQKDYDSAMMSAQF